MVFRVNTVLGPRRLHPWAPPDPRWQVQGPERAHQLIWHGAPEVRWREAGVVHNFSLLRFHLPALQCARGKIAIYGLIFKWSEFNNISDPKWTYRQGRLRHGRGIVHSKTCADWNKAEVLISDANFEKYMAPFTSILCLTIQTWK